MIEKLLESAIMAQLAAVLPQGTEIVGAWQTSAPGVVKGSESGTAAAFVAVAVSPRSFETFTTPKANFAVAISLKVRAERDPQGALFTSCADAMLALLQQWQTSLPAVRTAMSVDGFTPHGMRIDGGQITTDAEAEALVVAESFTVRGIVSQPTTGDNNELG